VVAALRRGLGGRPVDLVSGTGLRVNVRVRPLTSQGPSDGDWTGASWAGSSITAERFGHAHAALPPREGASRGKRQSSCCLCRPCRSLLPLDY
jgi:hypothetical protein